jgi:hypothetical protein
MTGNVMESMDIERPGTNGNSRNGQPTVEGMPLLKCPMVGGSLSTLSQMAFLLF